MILGASSLGSVPLGTPPGGAEPIPTGVVAATSACLAISSPVVVGSSTGTSSATAEAPIYATGAGYINAWSIVSARYYTPIGAGQAAGSSSVRAVNLSRLSRGSAVGAASVSGRNNMRYAVGSASGTSAVVARNPYRTGKATSQGTSFAAGKSQTAVYGRAVGTSGVGGCSNPASVGRAQASSAATAYKGQFIGVGSALAGSNAEAPGYLRNAANDAVISERIHVVRRATA